MAKTTFPTGPEVLGDRHDPRFYINRLEDTVASYEAAMRKLASLAEGNEDIATALDAAEANFTKVMRSKLTKAIKAKGAA